MYQLFTAMFLIIRLTWTPLFLKSFQKHVKIIDEFDFTKIENIKTFTPELKQILHSLFHPVYITKSIIEFWFFIWLCITGFKFFIPFVSYIVLHSVLEYSLEESDEKIVMKDLLDIVLMLYVIYSI